MASIRGYQTRAPFHYIGCMQPLLIIKLLVLLLAANGAPLVAARVLGRRFSFPVDGGLKLPDGRPLLGPTKTLLGTALGIATPAGGAPIMGLDWEIGALVGAGAMTGDLFSSFVKRRMGRSSSDRVTGLDQVPEALFPLVACSFALDLTVADIIVGVLMFFVTVVVLSRVLFKLGIRNRPH